MFEIFGKKATSISVYDDKVIILSKIAAQTEEIVIPYSAITQICKCYHDGTSAAIVFHTCDGENGRMLFASDRAMELAYIEIMHVYNAYMARC